MSDTILVTGGAGYVGSHVVVELAKAGYAPLVLDNFATSSRAVLPCLATLTGVEVPCVEADVRDIDALRRTFHDCPITGVIHCAGLKAVGEAEMRPLTYYGVNVGGAFALTEVMGEAGVATLVYSSSATVYGQPDPLPVNEDAPLAPQSVYGRTKRIVEDFLRDLARANPNWRIAILRYFNPAGAHPSGLIGEAPTGRPNNLVPLLCRIAAGEFSISRSTAPTGPRPTVQGCATICTCRTWRPDTSLRCDTSRPTQVPSRSIWASDAGVPFSTSSLRSKARAVGGSLDRSRRAAPATSPPVMRIRRARRSSWGGARPVGSTRSARMRGGGSRTAASTRWGVANRTSATLGGLSTSSLADIRDRFPT